MNDINIRFKQLRESCDKTQAEFGKVLGLSVSGVSDIERGKRNVTEQHLIMLSNWKERNVNIDWLRTGEGCMFFEPEKNDIIARASILLGEKDPIFESFVNTYSRLNQANRKVLANFFTDLAEELIKKKE